MKALKKITALLLAVLMCTSILASCGITYGEQEETSDKIQDILSNKLTESSLSPFEIPEGGYDGSEVTIKFYHSLTGDSASILEKYISKFNALYPDIHIEHTKYDSNFAIYSAVSDADAEKAPNIVCCSSDIAALYADARYAVSLDELVNSKITVTDAQNNSTVLGITDDQKNDFIDAFYIEGSKFENGVRYTLPLSRSTEVLYYNKTFFEEKAICEPQTWDHMHSLLPIIMAYGTNPVLGAYSSGADLFITLSAQRGSEYTSADGDHFLFNNETNHGIVERMVDYFTWYSTSASDVYDSDIPSLFKNTDPSAKTCYMVIASSADALSYLPEKGNGAYPFEVGIAPIPQIASPNSKVITHGSNICIFNNEDPQKVVASWLFSKFLTTNAEFQSELSMTSGNMPVINSAIELPAYQDFLSKADGGDNLLASAAKASLAQKDAFFAPPAFDGSLLAYAEIDKLIKECVMTDPQLNLDPSTFVPKAFEDAMTECKKYK